MNQSMSNSAPANTTRIAVADDSAVIRNLLEEILSYVDGYQLVASFDNGRDIVAWVREGGEADVYVIDMRLPGTQRHRDDQRAAALHRDRADPRLLSLGAGGERALGDQRRRERLPAQGVDADRAAQRDFRWRRDRSPSRRRRRPRVEHRCPRATSRAMA